MGRIKGTAYTCDRCGKKTFVEGSSEDCPSDWIYIPQIGYLCSKCGAYHDTLMDAFKSLSKITICFYEIADDIEVKLI